MNEYDEIEEKDVLTLLNQEPFSDDLFPQGFLTEEGLNPPESGAIFGQYDQSCKSSYHVVLTLLNQEPFSDRSI